MIVYLETSAFVKMFMDEAGSEAVAGIWDGADKVVSSVVTYVEARAAIAAARRARRLTTRKFADSRAALEFRWEDVEVLGLSDDIVRSAGDLAEQHALRGYDAVHLASCLVLSGEEGFVLATADDDLVQAAFIEGVQVSQP